MGNVPRAAKVAFFLYFIAIISLGLGLQYFWIDMVFLGACSFITAYALLVVAKSKNDDC